MATTVTYGRSESGLKTLGSQIQGNCSKKINALGGSEYTTLVKLIKEISNSSLDIKEGTLYPVVQLDATDDGTGSNA